jgi:carboxyl-terminal processing protease
VDPKELYFAAMEGLLSKLDQNSAFIPPQEYQQFQEVIEQQFGGIGVLIEGPPVAKRLTVVSPIRNSPAFKAGLQPGDIILEINSESTENLTATDATTKMRGLVGESVNLKIKPFGSADPRNVTITRAEIPVDSVFGDRMQTDSNWNYFLEEDARIAYIRVSLFGERTADEFKAAVDAVRGRAQALVVDLRYNPGGILPSSVEMCDMFLDEGVIVSTRGRGGRFSQVRTADAALSFPKEIPMVVMVNDQSASASEIMAACLQDAGRAKVAGQRSYGKGTVQQVFDLESDQTALKFTTARFYRPNGHNIHRLDGMTDADDWGVTPDSELYLPLTTTQEIYLQKRWNTRGDPRTANAAEQPPAPKCAGDPQLTLVLDYLQAELAK